jgi:predicted acetylornithine/succinylornithine family transaminase
MPLENQRSVVSARSREAAHFLPVVRRLPLVLVEGLGARVRDAEGREYVDLTGGWGVTCIGHSHPALVEAICTQAGRLMQTTNLFYTQSQLDLLDRFSPLLPHGLTRSFFVSSGAEAMDGALKLAHRATGRTKFVSTLNSFHGRTIGALSVIGQAKHRDPYRALLPEPVFVPFGDLEAAGRAIDERTAAFVVEPIQGEGGVNVPPPGYLAGLHALCRARGALLILDEIQTGIGRTGKMFACEHEGVVPDVMTLGKGLGGGFPVAAVVTTEEVAATVSLGDHGGTYAGNPLACAAANAVLRVIVEDKLSERAAELGARVMERLRKFVAERPGTVDDVRGRGLLVGMSLTDTEHAATLSLRAAEAGVMLNVTAGRVMRLFPALNIPEEDLWPALETVLGLV